MPKQDPIARLEAWRREGRGWWLIEAPFPRRRLFLVELRPPNYVQPMIVGRERTLAAAEARPAGEEGRNG